MPSTLEAHAAALAAAALAAAALATGCLLRTFAVPPPTLRGSRASVYRDAPTPLLASPLCALIEAKGE